MNIEKIKKYADSIWKLRRDLVSDGYDHALNILKDWLPLNVCEYASGQECFTWIVPQKWTSHKAELKDVNGKILITDKDHPLHVVSYSQPFKGRISREELFKHLHTEPMVPDAIPFRFYYYKKDWALCCSEKFKAQLKDEYYDVEIDTSFEPGKLKVGEYRIQGKVDKEILLISHLCHPHQFNDDLSGVLAGMALMEDLKAKEKELYYSYRLLIVPETIGSVAWLSDHQKIVPQITGGMFLEMLATKHPLALQKTYKASTQADKVYETTLKGMSKEAIVGNFREVVGNDEKQFNAPGIRAPILSLSRAVPEAKEKTRHFHEYHTSFDTPENANFDHMKESLSVAAQMLTNFENNYYVKNNFKCEIFLSRYNLFVDKYDDGNGNKAIFDILYDIDGTNSLADIAHKHSISFNTVWRFVKDLEKNNLVSLSRTAEVINDQ